MLRKRVRFDRRLPSFVLVCASLLAPRSAGAAASFARGPFLQSLGQTGVTVKVELLTPEAVSVEVTGPDGGVKKASISEARRFQSVRIEGLSPATAYSYKVLAGEPQTASEEGHFTTAPADDRPFKFVLYGDSRSDPAAHAAVVRAILATPSDFLVHTGDMVATGDEEDDWKSFFDVENSLLRDRCVFASIGNHELAGDKGVGAAAFLRYFASPDDAGKDRPKLYGSVRWGNTRLFLLNAMDDWSGEARAWLKDELDRAAGEAGLAHRIAVLHHGPYSSGPHGGNERLHKNGVMQIFKEGKVDLILAGHDHAYERGTGEGIKYVVSGGAGAPLYPRKRSDAETAIFESVHHFVEVSVAGDKIDIVAKRASGSVLEKCGFAGAGPWACEGAGKPDSAKAAAAPPTTDVQKGAACACGVANEERSAGAISALLAALSISIVRRRRRLA